LTGSSDSGSLDSFEQRLEQAAAGLGKEGQQADHHHDRDQIPARGEVAHEGKALRSVYQVYCSVGLIECMGARAAARALLVLHSHLTISAASPGV
jgi:hypothetical protein